MTTQGLQEDIYQRYTLLSRVLVAAFPQPPDGIVTILDIGSGPERLTERFLPAHFKVTRADVSTFGDEEVVQLRPGQRLPFDDRAFSGVIALEVLEHVPAPDRWSLITECARLASSIVVLSCPVAAPLTGRAEELFQAFATEISGETIAFLDEHRTVGLPDAAAVQGALGEQMPHVLESANSPLPEWLLYNLIDFTYACDFGDTEEKARFNAFVNASTPLVAAGAHYRRFFVGCRDAAMLEGVVASIPEPPPETDHTFGRAVTVARALVQFRRDLLTKHSDAMHAALGAKDAHITKLDSVIGALEGELRRVQKPASSPPVTPPVPSTAPGRVVGPVAGARQASTRGGMGPSTALRRARGRLRTLRIGKGVSRDQRTLVAQSGLFDETFYRAQSPDVAASGVDPLVHYLAVGGSEGRQPNPLFDSAYYLAHSPDVRASGVNPLVHYLTGGQREGRRPHPLFDSPFYVAQHPDVGESGTIPLAHYLATGASTGWDPSPLFWARYYLDVNPDVAASGVNPLVHYVLSGAREGRNPNPLFDASFYRAGHAEPLPASTDPLLHYLNEGAMQGRNPHPLFWSRYYLAEHPDVAQDGVNPLVHYLMHGGTEGRAPNPLFDAALYLAESANVVLPNGNPLAHYVTVGADAGRRAHVLFDATFYMAAHPELGGAPAGALAHYLATGAQTRWDPHPLFWSAYYLDCNPEVAAAGANPLVNYVVEGGAQGRNPNPLFDGAYYLARNPDVAARGINPLVHYIESGAAEGRKPSALFDGSYYLAQNPDVAEAGQNPLAHYLAYGRGERRSPNKLFDATFYLTSNPDVEATGADPLLHFRDHGAAEGRDPSPDFETSYYLRQNADVAAARANPLAHYLDHGESEGRRAKAPQTAVRVDRPARFVPPVGLLPWFNPLNLRVAPALDNVPRLNVLIPGLAMQHMSGGPNTALHIAYRLAVRGIAIRLISTDAAMSDTHQLWEHVLALAGSDRRPPNLEFADAHDRTRPFAIGSNDLFLATAWWTAQIARCAAELTAHQRFLYLIQDYEPLLHAASTSHALAEETYSLDFVPIVNSRLLFDFLTSRQIGRFSSPEFAARALVFEPAVDRSRFFVEPPDPTRKRRLLFYARPTTAERNLFELGVAALMDAADRGVFNDEPWELLAMGEAIAPIALGRGLTLEPAPWRDFDGYAAQMRQADVLVSLMLSPHPSYPPLEMAACGGFTVTTSFGSKTAERLAAISPNILAPPATIDGVASAIVEAIARSGSRRDYPDRGRIALPATWDESLDPILPGLHSAVLEAGGAPLVQTERTDPMLGSTRIACGFERWPASSYESFRIERLERRTGGGAADAHEGLMSLVTTAWNTDPAFLDYLAASVFQQTGEPSFEWIIIDNGSDRLDTRRRLEQLATHPAVRLHRVEQNLGIAGGMRLGLEKARHRYILPLDSDDYLYSDCLQHVAAALRDAHFPALLYTDEDKFSDEGWRDPYFKPDWDPVLFVNSCYIAHLCAIDRERALQLGCYADAIADGSHDWDTFTRFMTAGHAPVHVPEVLYGWRMHSGSTAGNVASKPYVTASQRGVLGRFLASQPCGDRFAIEKSPLFGDSPDWWIRRMRRDARAITTVLVQRSDDAHSAGTPAVDPGVPHEITHLAGPAALARLRDIAVDCADRGRLVHLLGSEVTVDDTEWAWEAIGLIELFPDTVMVGGRIHDGKRIISGGLAFGFGDGWGSPDEGRTLRDPGYFAQAWKPHSVSAVSAEHAVVDARFLASALEWLDDAHASITSLGPWLGALARRSGKRVVYSPFLSGRICAQHRAFESGARERETFRIVNDDLIPERQLLSPHLGLTGDTAYVPVTEEKRRHDSTQDASTLPEYATWLSARIWGRRAAYPLPAQVPSLSVLTTVYSGTQASLFEQTAETLLAQTLSFSEWIILAHGPTSPGIDAALERLQQVPNVRVLRLPENLGIVGGMRQCLLASSGDYIIPMDADDLLTLDALHVLASVIGRRDPAPMLVYSDEDVWRNEGPESPYARPDFDPVLNADSSYVWHVCAIRRDAALTHGAYSEPDTEYCHDWDTITRIAAIEDPVHVREVLYHWRHHAGSHTNRVTQNPGSIDSTRRLLQKRLSRLPNSSLFEVADFPLFRGARELYVRRRHVDPPPVAVVVNATVTADAASVLDRLARCGFPFSEVAVVGNAREQAAKLREFAATDRARYVAVLSAAAMPEGDEWIWEAVRLFESHEGLALCGGRVLDRHGTTVRSCGVVDGTGWLVHPFVALEKADPGPFALALKSHLVATVPGECYVATAEALRGGTLDTVASQAEVMLRLATRAWGGGRGVAYSPLIDVRVEDVRSLAPLVDVRAPAALIAGLAGRCLGAAGFATHRRQYRAGIDAS